MKIVHYDYSSNENLFLTSGCSIVVYNPDSGVLQIADVDLIGPEEKIEEDEENVKY